MCRRACSTEIRLSGFICSMLMRRLCNSPSWFSMRVSCCYTYRMFSSIKWRRLLVPFVMSMFKESKPSSRNAECFLVELDLERLLLRTYIAYLAVSSGLIRDRPHINQKSRHPADHTSLFSSTFSCINLFEYLQ